MTSHMTRKSYLPFEPFESFGKKLFSSKSSRNNELLEVKHSESSTFDYNNYPRKMWNTFINSCYQGDEHIIERFGKYHHTEKGGLYFAIPFVDSITVHNVRELCLPIEPQTGVTSDNVYTSLSGVLFVQVTDSFLATYGVDSPLSSVVKSAEAAMRNALGSMELDECFREKEKLNSSVMKHLSGITAPWGLVVKRYEVTSIDAPDEIKKSMNKQAAAERDRREAELGANANAAVIIKLADANKKKDIDESLGKKVRLMNEAEGEANAIKLKADANRYSDEQNAMALGNQVKVLMDNANIDGAKALGFMATIKYTNALENMGGSSNTMFMNTDAGDVSSVIAKGMAGLNCLQKAQ